MISAKNDPVNRQKPEETSNDKIDPTKTDTELIGCIAQKCTECGSCVRECDFLQRQDCPGTIAKQYLSGHKDNCKTIFYCNLCGLCSAVCPEKLPVKEMFLALRRAAVTKGDGKFKEHKRILNYEKTGSSWPFSCNLLPDRCSTVFFPGCTLPAIRPEQTLALFDSLKKQIPDLGFVLNCCNKPSHDLGRQREFLEEFSRKLGLLRDHGVTKIITVCPNCFQIFRQYGGGIEVSIAYTYLVGDQEPNVDANSDSEKQQGMYTVQDPCVMRFEPEIQQVVRELAESKGLLLTEMAHKGEKTYCCGEGGAVNDLARGDANSWKKKRLAEAGDVPLLTYCAGCTVTLLPRESSHILDIIFPGQRRVHGVKKTVRAPFTYLNRLLLKRKVMRCFRKSEGLFLHRK